MSQSLIYVPGKSVYLYRYQDGHPLAQVFWPVRLLIRPANSPNVIPAKAGIQQRALRAHSNWIPGQARNDEIHTICWPDQ
jgi:hypothetical protein